VADAVTVPDRTARAQRPASHPLDPLTPAELRIVVAGVRSALSLDRRHLFVLVELHEPDKDELERWRPDDPLGRRARVAVWDQAVGELSEGIVSVTGEVESWDRVPGVQAPALPSQLARAIAAVTADDRVRQALARRGVEDPDLVHVEVWPFGGLLPEHLDSGRRWAWTPMWERRSADDNAYAHPIDGVYAVVDLDTGEVIEVEDHGVVPVPPESGHYRESQTETQRQVSRLEIIQPEGPGFAIDGWAISWQKWSLRVGFSPREGLVIHDVRYDDDGTTRRIAHRLSIAELVIPYGDPSPGSFRKNAFDTGEIFIGGYTNSLELGCDCLGEIRYLDAAVVDDDGTVREIPNAICLHEEDAGVLWKHTDTDGHVEVRRSRRFVVSSVVTIDNYEYGYFWYFMQDGSIEFEAKLTGIVLTLAGEPGAPARYATQLADGLLAPNHQHIFCARLDLDLDGRSNTVVEVDAVSPPVGPDNPYGGAFYAAEAPLKSERSARRLVDPFHSRYWKIINPGRLNERGQPVAYKLVPGQAMFPAARPESSIGRRAAFMYHHLWVTPFDPDERYPAGDHPFQHPGGAGLPAWTSADRNVADTDIVLWHVFGTTHIPRTEDWPVMPVERTGFQLKPVGFFDRNPSLDVPPERHCGHARTDG
jgi:primary-amine oxidase